MAKDDDVASRNEIVNGDARRLVVYTPMATSVFVSRKFSGIRRVM